jgi:Cu(I)/Ag(I) efflux system membrane fusion protein
MNPSAAEHEDAEQPGTPLPEGEEAPPRGVLVMAFVRWLLVFAMAVAATASLGRHFGLFAEGKEDSALYQCPMHPSVVQDHPGECPICGMDLVRMGEATRGNATTSDAANHHEHAEHAYFCPMHPEVSSDDPNATCSKCGGMKLVKRSEPSPMTGVELSAERVRQMGITTARVEHRTAVPQLRAVGMVSANEARVVRVHTRISGYVEQLFVDQSFAEVRAGQPLYGIYSPELIALEREFLTAHAWSARADAAKDGTPNLAEATQKRLELLGLDEKDVEGLVQAGEPPRTLTVRAPVSGVVTQKEVVRGSFVEAGSLLFELTDLHELWVLAEVPQAEAWQLRKGGEAKVRVASEQGTRTGKIGFIYPMLDPARRTVQVRINLPNPDLSLRPGVSAEVDLGLEPITGLFVPRSAVIDSGQGSYVFVAHEDFHFERKPIRVGARAQDWLNVLEGLREGESVATNAGFLLDSETRLQNVGADTAPDQAKTLREKP